MSEEKARLQLEDLDKQRAVVKQQLDRERLLRVTGKVVEVITTPQFVEKMRVARKGADDNVGMDAVAKLLSIEGLRREGVDIPEDFRLTSRTFEDKVTGQRFDIKEFPLPEPAPDPDRPPKPGPGPDPSPLRWGVCGGGGGLTFCGCGGFST